jgi:hydrogenase maturation factor
MSFDLIELQNIPPQYIYFKPKDIAHMAVSISSDILMSDADDNHTTVKMILENTEFLKRFIEISDLINKCGKDIADFINK